MQAQTSPQIESIKHMKLNCSKKVVTAISQLSKEIQDCQEAYLRNPETHLQVGLATIQQTKEKVLVMVSNRPPLQSTHSGLLIEGSSVFREPRRYIHQTIA